MKIFVYKTLIVIFSVYLLFQFTVGLKIGEYEKKLEKKSKLPTKKKAFLLAKKENYYQILLIKSKKN